MSSAQICPQCGKHLLLDLATDQMKCMNCGYIRPDEISGLTQKEQAVKAHGVAPSVQFIYKGEIRPYAKAAFDSGQDALYEGDKGHALACFRRAAEDMPDWPDAHLWIAKVCDDEKIKRDELSIVQALMPNNLEVLRMLMVLDGRLTPEQATQTYHFNDQQVQQTTDPVNAKATSLLCPVCGGDLTINDQLRQVECRFCGYRAAQKDQPVAADGQLLTLALLERKAKPVRWNVGQRTIQCQQCGAEHTLTGEQMTERCRFCGSNEVIIGDALGSFTQPEGLIPFKIDQAQAKEQINQALHSITERVVGLFNSNKVERGTVEGVYLPFWTFDALVEVTKVKMRGFAEQSRETFTEADNDVPVCAVKSPPRELTYHLGQYDCSEVVPYEPKWLAKYPAELYSLDFDQASVEAHSVVADAMKQKYSWFGDSGLPDLRRNDDQVTVNIFSDVQNMSFRLLLMPVWIGTLVEADGDIRLAVINGQTGKTALGKAHKISR